MPARPSQEKISGGKYALTTTANMAETCELKAHCICSTTGVNFYCNKNLKAEGNRVLLFASASMI